MYIYRPIYIQETGKTREEIGDRRDKKDWKKQGNLKTSRETIFESEECKWDKRFEAKEKLTTMSADHLSVEVTLQETP